MSSMTLGQDVAATPEEVWRVITDLDRAADVVSSIKEVWRLDGEDGFGVGTRWRETRVMLGREASETMEVTAIDEGRSYTVEAESRGAHYTSVMAVEPNGDGSRLSMTFEARPTTTVARLMALFGRLFEGSARKAMARDLRDVAAAAERDEGGAA